MPDSLIQPLKDDSTAAKYLAAGIVTVKSPVIKGLITHQIEQHADAIHRGLIIQAMRASLDDDYNALDMDSLARIGINTQMPQMVSGVEVTFDNCSTTWVSVEGDEFEMSSENGLPVVEEQ